MQLNPPLFNKHMCSVNIIIKYALTYWNHRLIICITLIYSIAGIEHCSLNNIRKWMHEFVGVRQRNYTLPILLRLDFTPYCSQEN